MHWGLVYLGLIFKNLDVIQLGLKYTVWKRNSMSILRLTFGFCSSVKAFCKAKISESIPDFGFRIFQISSVVLSQTLEIFEITVLHLIPINRERGEIKGNWESSFTVKIRTKLISDNKYFLSFLCVPF